MEKLKNWKEFINKILIESKQFENPTSALINETEIETFKSTDKNSLTEIRAEYLKDNLLINLQIFNPKIPGYNKFVEAEYFHEFDFTPVESYGNPALEFNSLNKEGILMILKEGLKGKEIQFLKNGEILKSNLNLLESSFYPEIKNSYDFTDESFWKKIFRKKIEDMNGIEKREIELNKIFNGINYV